MWVWLSLRNPFKQELVKRKCPKHGLWVCEKCVWAYGFNESQEFTGIEKWHREGNIAHFVRTEKNLILRNSFIILDMIARNWKNWERKNEW